MIGKFPASVIDADSFALCIFVGVILFGNLWMDHEIRYDPPTVTAIRLLAHGDSFAISVASLFILFSIFKSRTVA